MRWPTAITLAVCCILVAEVAGVAAEDVNPQDYSCDAVGQVPKHFQCEFVTKHCDSDSRIPYERWYYCQVQPYGIIARFFYMLLLVAVLPLFFTLLGDTAELYFSPTMALVSQTIPKMRPRFAGVTFVAIGNGAPDLSANISAIRNGDMLLSAGALTGAAMFVQCIVASEVVRVSRNAVKCRGATIRDLGCYVVAISMVMLTLQVGVVTKWFVAGAFILYTGYAIWVFCGDEWHERGRPEARVVLQGLRQSLTRGIDSLRPARADDTLRQGLLPWAAVEPTDTHDIHEDTATATATTDVRQRHPRGFLDARTYRNMVWAELGDPSERNNEPVIPEPRTHLTNRLSGSLSVQRQLELGPASPSPSPVIDEEERVGLLHGQADGSAQPKDADEVSVASSRRPRDKTWWEIAQHELTMGSCEEWENLQPRILYEWRRFTFWLLLPVYAALRSTIPFVDPALYQRQWLVVSMLCCPLAALVYFNAFTMWAVVLAAIAGAVMGIVTALLTSDSETVLPDLSLGTRFAFGPAFFTLVGFFMGVLWIDTLASEVVGMIGLLASSMNIPSSVVGLTLLAFGASIGDLYNNPAMARRGHSSTALTACFAGPLFSLLISMAVGWSGYFARNHVSRADVHLRPEVALGCGFLIAYNVIFAITGLVNKFQIPRKWYLFARAWYGLYFVSACIIGFATA